MPETMGFVRAKNSSIDISNALIGDSYAEALSEGMR
jgi:hypothetical protein